MSPVAETVVSPMELFWKHVHALEGHHNTCVQKLGFIDKVLTGAESVSWTLLDRVREAQLQLNQASHCFQLRQSDACSMLAEQQARDRLNSLIDEQERVVKAAERGIATIMSWVPPAPNTRRSDGQGNLGDRRA